MSKREWEIFEEKTLPTLLGFHLFITDDQNIKIIRVTKNEVCSEVHANRQLRQIFTQIKEYTNFHGLKLVNFQGEKLTKIKKAVKENDLYKICELVG